MRNNQQNVNCWLHNENNNKTMTPQVDKFIFSRTTTLQEAMKMACLMHPNVYGTCCVDISLLNNDDERHSLRCKLLLDNQSATNTFDLEHLTDI